MRQFQTVLLGLMLFMPAVCFGQGKCPWINEATARGILGGDVTVNTKLSGEGEGVCTFSRQQGARTEMLRISVNILGDIPKQFPTYLAQCPAKSAALWAIGNEAIACSTESKEEPYAEKVVGRVRNQAFVVSVSSSVRDDASMTQEMRRERANRVAEQIAGFLF